MSTLTPNTNSNTKPNPISLSKLLHYKPTSTTHCLGSCKPSPSCSSSPNQIPPMHRRPCTNKLSATSRARAAQVLQTGSALFSARAPLRTCLEQLAPLVLCVRDHQDQVGGLVQWWWGRIMAVDEERKYWWEMVGVLREMGVWDQEEDQEEEGGEGEEEEEDGEDDWAMEQGTVVPWYMEIHPAVVQGERPAEPALTSRTPVDWTTNYQSTNQQPSDSQLAMMSAAHWARSSSSTGTIHAAGQLPRSTSLVASASTASLASTLSFHSNRSYSNPDSTGNQSISASTRTFGSSRPVSSSSSGTDSDKSNVSSLLSRLRLTPQRSRNLQRKSSTSSVDKAKPRSEKKPNRKTKLQLPLSRALFAKLYGLGPKHALPTLPVQGDCGICWEAFRPALTSAPTPTSIPFPLADAGAALKAGARVKKQKKHEASAQKEKGSQECLEAEYDFSQWIWCRGSCGTSYHKECLGKWIDMLRYLNQKPSWPTCPTCRVEWAF